MDSSTVDQVQDGPDEAIERVADARDPDRDITVEDQSAATAWFLEGMPEQVASREIELNVGKFDEKGELIDHFVRWRVGAVDRDRIRQIRRQSRGRGRGAAAGQEEDDMKVNLRIAAEGTLDPDLGALASQKGIQDPAQLLNMRFAHKPGLIDQIANEVLNVSGYDDGDVRAVEAGKS